MKNSFTEPIILRGQEGSINVLAFSPDAEWLAAGSDNKTSRLWNLNTDYMLKSACKVVGCNFTHLEWAQYFPNEEYRKTCEQWPLEPEVAATPTTTP